MNRQVNPLATESREKCKNCRSGSVEPHNLNLTKANEYRSENGIDGSIEMFCMDGRNFSYQHMLWLFSLYRLYPRASEQRDAGFSSREFRNATLDVHVNPSGSRKSRRVSSYTDYCDLFTHDCVKSVVTNVSRFF